jgi:hypothetical protein
MPAADSRSEQRSSASRWHLLLLLVPFVWQVGLANFANDIAWMPLGLPFQMAWQMAGVVVSSFAIYLVYRLDKARNTSGEDL